MRLNKRGQEGMTLGTLLLIVLGVVVLVVLIVGFTGGFGFIFNKIDVAPLQSLETAKQSCVISGEYGLNADYCLEFKQIKLNKVAQLSNCDYLQKQGLFTKDNIDITCSPNQEEIFCNSGKIEDKSDWEKVKVNGKPCKDWTGNNFNVKSLETGVIVKEDPYDIGVNNFIGDLHVLDNCEENLEERKKRLEIPEKYCYWEQLTQHYLETCKNLEREDIEEIFHKKEMYAKAYNQDWSDLTVYKDICVPVIYDCKAWKEANQPINWRLGVQVYKVKNFGPDKGIPFDRKILLNPYIGTKNLKEQFKSTLLHEGLHSIQNKVYDTKILNEEVSLPSNSEELVENANEQIEIGARELSNYFDSIGESSEKENYEEIIIDVRHYEIVPTELKRRLDKLKEFLKENNKYDNRADYLIEFIYSQSELKFDILNKERALEYLSDKDEIEPRLSDVNRWWLDKEGKNSGECRVVTNTDDAATVLLKFLEEDLTDSVYKTTQDDLHVIIYFAEKEGRLYEVFEQLAARLPGLAEADTFNDGTALA